MFAATAEKKSIEKARAPEFKAFIQNKIQDYELKLQWARSTHQSLIGSRERLSSNPMSFQPDPKQDIYAYMKFTPEKAAVQLRRNMEEESRTIDSCQEILHILRCISDNDTISRTQLDLILSQRDFDNYPEIVNYDKIFQESHSPGK